MTWDASSGGWIGIDTVLDETGLVELTRQWDDEFYCAWHDRIAKAAIVATVVVTVMKRQHHTIGTITRFVVFPDGTHRTG